MNRTKLLSPLQIYQELAQEDRDIMEEAEITLEEILDQNLLSSFKERNDND